MDRVVITRPMVGICHMQVCVAKGVTDVEILAKANAANPSGTSAGWTRVCRESGVPCEEHPERTHYLVEC